MLQGSHVGPLMYWIDFLLFVLKTVFWKLYLLPKSGLMEKIRDIFVETV